MVCLLGKRRVFVLCLSCYCFGIVLLCDMKSFVYFFLFVLVSNFLSSVLREELYIIVSYFVIYALLFGYCYLLGNHIDCLSNCFVGESTF